MERTVWLILRSSLFTVGLMLSTVIYAPLTLLTFPLGYVKRYRFVSQWSRFNLWWLGVTCRLRHEVEGLENIPDKPAVVLVKHQSAWETLALQRLFVPQVWVIKRELLWIPFFGWGLAMLRPIAIDRRAAHRAVKQVVEQGRHRLASGCSIIIFPEGTRVAPGERKPYLPGGALLAKRSGYPIVPIAHNAGEFWPRHGFIKRPGIISLVIGPPIDAAGRDTAEVNRLAEQWIEGQVARLTTGCLEGHKERERRAREQACSVENT
ncbi:MAG: lysophospholipid acyltransferase family protein [Gammaproteobacteria bacterium]|jgi:1-acyl-sn-glycerol-3-phosphate acyltransferase